MEIAEGEYNSYGGVLEKSVGEWKSELKKIMSLFASSDSLSKAQKKSARGNLNIFNPSYLGEIIDCKIQFKPTEIKVNANATKKLDKVFTSSQKRIAKIEFIDIAFPLSLFMEKFKNIQAISCLQIILNPKFLKYTEITEFERFWKEVIVQKGVTHMRKLSLSRIGLGVESGKILIQSLKKLPALKLLDLSWNNLGTVNMAKLAVIVKSLPELISLDISGNKIWDSGFSLILDGVEESKTLQDLNWSLNDLSPLSSQLLYKFFKSNKAVERLNVSFNSIGGNGLLSCLEGLMNNKILTIFNMASNDINDSDYSDIDYFCEILVRSGLKKLNLSLNYIRGDKKQIIRRESKKNSINVILDNE